MKLKKIGNFLGIVIGTIYIAAVLYLEASRKLDWKTLLILFLFFVVWGIIVFANLAAFFDNKEINFLGVKIASTQGNNKVPDGESNSQLKLIQKQIDELEKKVRSIESDVRDMKQTSADATARDFHKEFEQFKLNQVSPVLILLEKYESPKQLEEFVKLVKEAKASKYNLENDIIYREIVEDYRENIVLQLTTVLEEIAKNNVFTDLQGIFLDAINSDSINQETFDTVKKQLIIDNSDNKLKIINTFSKAINDLKKLEE
ncbi:hypothetical protein [Limosilactobacillus reuteri]|uniref:hypothetical protein n=2 Tax=Limosilactobacillus reuteri TaxID=1598 RepID=UPI001C3FCA43|nr:hypothetical protein [Limosilactobacillus reuteri]MCC4369222.1 hypothetical protein [Limosilactobacillus reuteri]MDD7006059.1 hypothetical protein [Lactobacillus johnsonii]MDY6195527.1 hypothetical protein [Lactobacillus johnsonii]UNL40041.1 hypothetical protein G8B24_01960 [Limosilactobacillus reuteri]